MKWSKDWAPMADQPVGAWCTNHWTWYSDEYNMETCFGWDNRVDWMDRSVVPDGAYRVEEFLKIMKVGDDPEAWDEYAEGGAYSAGWGEYESGVPKYVVFQDTIEVYDVETGDMVASYDLCTTAPKGLGQPLCLCQNEGQRSTMVDGPSVFMSYPLLVRNREASNTVLHFVYRVG